MYADWITIGQNLKLTLNGAQLNMYCTYLLITWQAHVDHCDIFKPMHALPQAGLFNESHYVQTLTWVRPLSRDLMLYG